MPKASPIQKIGLLTPSIGYKPFRYPWAYSFWKRQQQIHWMPEEVPMGNDVSDWEKLPSEEGNFLTHVFRFFTQSDIEVNDNYMERYARVFKPTEVKMMLGAFANMETIHIDAYSLLVETVGMPETIYTSFMDYQAMRDKHNYMAKFDVEDDASVLKTLACFGGATEGLQLFASFAMLMNFPRQNKMKGMGQIVSWSVRDESLHCLGIAKLFDTYAKESGALTSAVKEEIRDHFRNICQGEFKFVDLAFEMGDLHNLTKEEMYAYIKYICDYRLNQYGLEPIWGVTEHPLPWLQALLSGVEHANFFEGRATEYSKAASTGKWQGKDGVWDRFDRRGAELEVVRG